MSHAKVMLADGKIAAVGSANLTPRSMFTSREITLFVHGTHNTPFIRKLSDQFYEDIKKSERVLEPFELNVAERSMAYIGKYIW